jgi:phosphatidylinositol alpha-mannosyltransferase
MKIGLVFPYNIARGGGVKEIVLALQSELNARGHETLILTPQPRDLNDVDTTGIVFLGNAADFKAAFHTNTQISLSADTDRINEVLRREKFDILHFHEPWVPMLSRQILTRSDTVNIATFHAKIPETMMSRTVVKVVTPYTKSVMKYLDELTAVSEAAAEWVSSTTEEPVRIIPNGIDLKRFKYRPKALELPGKTILYVGRLERRKGVKYLIQAFALLQTHQPEVHLIIAGDGPDRQKLEQLVKEMELDNVDFRGYVTEKEKLKLLASADLFCSPALYGESFGIVLLEAMAVGLVTVAGDNPGYTSVMQDMGSVSLVDPHHVVEFSKRLDLLLNQEELRAVWRNWAKDYVKKFSYTKVVDEYEAVYEEACEKHSANKHREHPENRE